MPRTCSLSTRARWRAKDRATAAVVAVLVVAACGGGDRVPDAGAGDAADAAVVRPDVDRPDVAQVWYAAAPSGLAAIGIPSGCRVPSLGLDAPDRDSLQVAYAAGLIWVASSGGLVTAVDPATSRITSSQRVDAGPNTTSAFLAPAGAGVVVAVEGGIRRFDRDGVAGPVTALPDPGRIALRSVDGRLFAATDTAVYALSDDPLAVEHTYPTGGRLGSWQVAGDEVVMEAGDRLRVVGPDGAVVSEVLLSADVEELAVAGGRAIASGTAHVTSYDLGDLADRMVLADAGGARPKIAAPIGDALWALDEDGPSLVELDPAKAGEGRSVRLPVRSDDPQMTVTPVTADLAVVTDFETYDVYSFDTARGRVERLGFAEAYSYPLAVTPPIAPCR